MKNGRGGMVRIREHKGQEASSAPPAKKARSGDDSHSSNGGANGSSNGTSSTHRPVLSTPPSSQSSPGGDSSSSMLWVDKYKPKSSKQIIGQQGDKSNLRKLVAWVQNWDRHHGDPSRKAPPRPPPWGASGDNGAWAKVALLSGPPGVGKTTTAHLVARELGYDVFELNASDARSKKLLDNCLADAMSSMSVSQEAKKRIILMDEVDGMAGNEDRGGVAELIALTKKSRTPVICMCNDRQSPKIRSLANHCFDLRFQRPRADQIRAAMMSVCFKEKVKIAPDALTELIVGCNQDVRQVLHHLSLLKGRGDAEEKMTAEQAKSEAESSKKTSIKVGPFDVVRKVFTATEQKGKSLNDKADLFFQDYSLGPLFNQEMYLNVEPQEAKSNKDAMKLISKAADSFCDGDLVDKTIRSNNAWSLLPTQAMFSSVIPGEYMSGFMKGQIQFPSWFGKYSRTNKINRILQELQSHTRLSAGVSKRAMNEDFSQHLCSAITRPLVKQGSEGIGDSLDVMKHYSLLREDLDNLIEVTTWPGQSHPLASVEPKVKAAFTRQYNKEVVLPFATGAAVAAKRRGGAASAEDAWAEEEAEEEDEEDKDNIEADSMIKAKKPSAARGKGSAAAAKKESSAAASGKGKGGGKGASKRAKK